jgi:predicted Zn-dependent protease
MGALANLLDMEGRILRKADGLATRGLALLGRGRKYRAHRAITRAYGAIEHGRSRITRRPTDAAAVYGKIARGYHTLSNPEAAWRAAQDGLSFDPRNPDALEVQGLLQLARGEPKDALASFDRALKSAPHVAALWTFRGDAAVAAGKKD